MLPVPGNMRLYDLDGRHRLSLLWRYQVAEVINGIWVIECERAVLDMNQACLCMDLLADHQDRQLIEIEWRGAASFVPDVVGTAKHSKTLRLRLLIRGPFFISLNRATAEQQGRLSVCRPTPDMYRSSWQQQLVDVKA